MFSPDQGSGFIGLNCKATMVIGAFFICRYIICIVLVQAGHLIFYQNKSDGCLINWINPFY